MAIYKIKIAKVTEIKAHNGSTFNAYKTVDKNGRFMDLKFQKQCRNVPDSPCWIYVTGEKDDAHYVPKGTRFSDR